MSEQEFQAAAARAAEVTRAEEARTKMARADRSIDEVMEVAERAKQACEERDRRHGVREPNAERSQKSVEILRRLPRFLRDVSRSTLEARITDPRLLEASRWWHWERGNLVLMGPPGCGKSTAAALIVYRMVAGGVRVGGFEWSDALGIWWDAAPELELARKQHPLGQGEAPEILRACGARLLVIDDAGWDRDPSAVSYVLDQRMQRGVQTIITTGRNREELSDHYGAAVVRRIVEVGGRQARIVECFEEPPEAAQHEHDAKTRAAGGE